MSELVLDASVVVDLLIGVTPQSVEAAIAEQPLVAPPHLDAEVLSSLARLHRGGTVTAATVTEALGLLVRLPIQRLPVTEAQLQTAWRLRDNVATRDALYLALAQLRSSVVLTKDQRLRRAAPSLTIGLDEIGLN